MQYQFSYFYKPIDRITRFARSNIPTPRIIMLTHFSICDGINDIQMYMWINLQPLHIAWARIIFVGGMFYLVHHPAVIVHLYYPGASVRWFDGVHSNHINFGCTYFSYYTTQVESHEPVKTNIIKTRKYFMAGHKKRSSAFYFQKFKTSNDWFLGGQG